MNPAARIVRSLKVAFMLLLVGTPLLPLTMACRQKAAPEKAASDVVVSFFEALYEKDYGSAIPLCTERCLRQVTDNGDNAFVTVRDDHDSGGNIYTESKVVSVPHGQNTVEIYSQDDEDLRIWLIKVDGKWQIDEFVFNGGGDGNNGDGARNHVADGDEEANNADGGEDANK